MLSDYFLIIKKQILEAFSSPELTPDQIAEFMLSSKERIIRDRQLQFSLSHKVEQQKIENLYHFTQLKNVKKIVQYGLISSSVIPLAIREVRDNC